MLLERSMSAVPDQHVPRRGGSRGGPGFFVDAGGPMEPLFEAAERHGITPTHVLLTHHHYDHVCELDAVTPRYPGIAVLAHPDEPLEAEPFAPLDIGGLAVDAAAHAGPHGRDAQLHGRRARLHRRHAVQELRRRRARAGQHLLRRHQVLDHGHADGPRPATVVHPGHTDPTTVGEEWDANSFIRIWRGPGSRGRRAVHGARRAGDAGAARRRLRRRPQGVGPLARRARRHRPRLAGRAPAAEQRIACAKDAHPATIPLAPRPATVGRLAATQAAKQMGTRATNVARSDEGKQARAGAAPARDRRADRRRAGDDEGRGDEARPGHVVPRRRPRPRGVPRGVPGQARRAARRGAEGLLQGHEEGHRGRVRREARGRLRDLRPGADRRRLDRPGLQGQARGRPRRRGQGPVPAASPRPSAPTCRTWG